jgi:hypothetical protein
MKCPRDGEELAHQGYWRHPRHHCERCSGLLVSEASLIEAMGHAGKAFAGAATHRIAELPKSDFLCPRDGRVMRALVFRGVEVDICEGCRLMWLGSVEASTDIVDFLGDAVGSLLDL